MLDYAEVHPGYQYDVSFLGSRYGSGDAFSKSMKVHDAALRDAVVLEMKRAFGDRFGMFGRGWAEFLGQHGIEHVEQTVPLNRAHEIYWRSRIGLNVSLCNFLENYSIDLPQSGSPTFPDDWITVTIV